MGRIKSCRLKTGMRFSDGIGFCGSGNEVETVDPVVKEFGRFAFFVQLDVQSQVVGGNGLAQGLFVTDDAVTVQFEKVLIHRLHSVGFGGFHDFTDVHQVALQDEVLDGGRVDEQVDNRRPARFVLFEGEALADDAGQVEGDVDQYLVVLFFGVEVEYAFERLRRGVGVERKNAQVAGLGELHRVFHTFPAADFADADHVGGLAHSVLYRRLPVYGVDADFALGKDAAARFVDKLNRVFDGNDMAGQGFVAVFEHSRHRGGFARTGRPDDNQQPARCDGEVFEFFGQAQFLHLRDDVVDAPQNQTCAALAVVGVGAVARAAARLDGVVDFAVAPEYFRLFGVHRRCGDGGGFLARQRLLRLRG